MIEFLNILSESLINRLTLQHLSSFNAVSRHTGSSDAGSWTPHDEDGGEEDIPDTPESLPPYPNNGE